MIDICVTKRILTSMEPSITVTFSELEAIFETWQEEAVELGTLDVNEDEYAAACTKYVFEKCGVTLD